MTFISTNIVGTANLLEAVRDYWNTLSHAAKKKFGLLHVSTDEVYGDLGFNGGLFNENAPYVLVHLIQLVKPARII